MGWLSVAVGVIAAALLYGTGHGVLFTFSVVFTIACLCSWGVMHNFATESAKRRSTYTGGFYDLTEIEVDSVPNWVTTINMLSTFAVVVILIIALFIRVI